MIKMESGSILPAPKPERVEWFEKAYRVTFPQEARQLFESYNGGVPTLKNFSCLGQERLIERFLPLLDSPRDSSHGVYDITYVITQVDDRLTDDENLVGMNVIPIAALFGGDLLCLDFRTDKNRPSVVVWSHEDSDELEPVFFPVASSFGEFAEQLHA